MEMNPSRSIRARLTVGFVAFLCLLMVLSRYGLIAYVQSRSDQRADRLLNAAVRKIRHEGAAHPGHLSQLLEDERDVTGENLGVVLIDPQGHVLEQGQRRAPFLSNRRAAGWRVATVPIGRDTAVIGLRWNRSEETVQSQARVLSALCVIILGAATVGAWLLVGRVLSPIGRLSEQANAASVETVRVRLAAPSNDREVVELVATLNGLLERLEQSAAIRGRFYAAASHELRTPLQVLFGTLELAMSRRRSAEEYEAMVAKAHRQTQRLISLVRDLLLINQLESLPAPPCERVPLTEVCEQVLLSLKELIAARNVRVETDDLNGMSVMAPTTHIEILCGNLIENAVKYTTPGGRVLITVSSCGQRLEIFNECALLPEFNATKLFEPFFRPDAARQSGTGGNGLGLTLCKAVADVNGWKLSLEQESAGIRCTVQFC
jgi:signal transduction histidine kinase